MQGESAMGRCQYSMCQSLTILISFKKLGADYNIILCWNLPIPTVGRGRRDKGRVAELFLTAIVLTRCRSLGFLQLLIFSYPHSHTQFIHEILRSFSGFECEINESRNLAPGRSSNAMKLQFSSSGQCNVCTE